MWQWLMWKWKGKYFSEWPVVYLLQSQKKAYSDYVCEKGELSIAKQFMFKNNNNKNAA